MKRIICCRAYGDFIIALNTAIHSKQPQQFELVASSHLKPLYDAIPPAYLNKDIHIQFVNWGIKGSLLRAFTNRFLLHPDMLHELISIKRWIKKQPSINTQWVLEQNKRQWLVEWITQTKFESIATNGNIYDAFQTFFEASTLLIPLPNNQPMQVLVLPTTRQSFKDIPMHSIGAIMDNLPQKKHHVTVAYFKKAPSSMVQQSTTYQRFDELIALILQADYIFAPDSLTAHLAYFFKKPHTILHSPKAVPSFLTPFTLANQCFYSFENHQAFVNIAHG